MIKKCVTALSFLLIFCGSGLALAQNEPLAASTSKEATIELFSQEYQKFGLDEADATERATSGTESLINAMEAEQYDLAASYDSLESQVHGLPTQGERREAATDVLEAASELVEAFTDLKPEEHLMVYPIIAGSPPYAIADEAFEETKESASAGIAEVRRVLIDPSRPGAVPAGNLVSDFIPQVIRQLYRFAWVGILIALTVSGVLFVTAQENDERLTKAKGMLYYSLIGFAFIVFSFAIVKALTDIDFFRFI